MRRRPDALQTIFISDAMQGPAENDFEPSDYVCAATHLQVAANAATAKQHAWDLELALGPLRRCECPKILNLSQRDELRLLLEEARATSLRLLTHTYSAKQIEWGYQAAHGVLEAWTIAPDDGRHGHVNSICRRVLGMFLFDVINMRRADEIAERLRGASLDDVLPPLPEDAVPLEGVVIPFPTFPRGSAR